jgi:hypothetical protein
MDIIEVLLKQGKITRADIEAARSLCVGKDVEAFVEALHTHLCPKCHTDIESLQDLGQRCYYYEEEHPTKESKWDGEDHKFWLSFANQLIEQSGGRSALELGCMLQNVARDLAGSDWPKYLFGLMLLLAEQLSLPDLTSLVSALQPPLSLADALAPELAGQLLPASTASSPPSPVPGTGRNETVDLSQIWLSPQTTGGIDDEDPQGVPPPAD